MFKVTFSSIESEIYKENQKLGSLPDLFKQHQQSWDGAILDYTNAKEQLKAITDRNVKTYGSYHTAGAKAEVKAAEEKVVEKEKILDEIGEGVHYRKFYENLEAQSKQGQEILASISTKNFQLETLLFLTYFSYLYPIHSFTKAQWEQTRNLYQKIKSVLQSSSISDKAAYLNIGFSSYSEYRMNSYFSKQNILTERNKRNLASTQKKLQENLQRLNIRGVDGNSLQARIYLTCSNAAHSPSSHSTSSLNFIEFLKNLAKMFNFYLDINLLNEDWNKEFSKEYVLSPLILAPDFFGNLKFRAVHLQTMSLLEHVVLAIILDNVELLKMLFEDLTNEKQAVTLQDFISNNFLFGFAVANGRIESVKYLLKNGINIEQKFTILCTAHTNTPAFLRKYAESSLVLTPLALAIQAAPHMPQEKAKELMNVLMDANANYNVKINRVWKEERGYHTARHTIEKSEQITLFNFDQTGILSDLVNERNSQKKNPRQHERQKNKLVQSSPMPSEPSVSSAFLSVPPPETNLLVENQALKAQVQQLWVMVYDLQQRMSLLEANTAHRSHPPEPRQPHQPRPRPANSPVPEKGKQRLSME